MKKFKWHFSPQMNTLSSVEGDDKDHRPRVRIRIIVRHAAFFMVSNVFEEFD